MHIPTTAPELFEARRKALLRSYTKPALLCAGATRPRNYRANVYEFRATSHMLYFCPAPQPGAMLLFAEGRAVLYTEPPTVETELWNGPTPSLADLKARDRYDDVRPLDALPAELARLGAASVAALSTNDSASSAQLSKLLGREVAPCSAASLADGSKEAELAEALASLRLKNDAGALAQLRAVCEATARAHIAGMRATRGAAFEYEVAAAILAELKRHNLGVSYNPIVSIHGEVLHNEHHLNRLAPGELLLSDVGGETVEGWAGDITRTWPVSGTFSSSQRALYSVVLAAQKEAVASIRPGVRYREIHLQAGRKLVEGLRELKILKGEVDGLVERGADGLFMPHGIGHLMGLDVHDMEDLGDRAAYAKGRKRATRLGERSLRLDLDLAPGMVVTIEPGFYQVPGLLNDPELTKPLGQDLDREVLARYSDVRGIRIEDDVLCTEGEPEVLTALAPKEVDAVEVALAS